MFFFFCLAFNSKAKCFVFFSYQKPFVFSDTVLCSQILQWSDLSNFYSKGIFVFRIFFLSIKKIFFTFLYY